MTTAVSVLKAGGLGNPKNGPNTSEAGLKNWSDALATCHDGPYMCDPSPRDTTGWKLVRGKTPGWSIGRGCCRWEAGCGVVCILTGAGCNICWLSLMLPLPGVSNACCRWTSLAACAAFMSKEAIHEKSRDIFHLGALDARFEGAIGTAGMPSPSLLVVDGAAFTTLEEAAGDSESPRQACWPLSEPSAATSRCISSSGSRSCPCLDLGPRDRVVRAAQSRPLDRQRVQGCFTSLSHLVLVWAQL